MIIDAQGGKSKAKYGDGLIRKYSERLTKEIGKGYSTRSLKLMRKFYLFQKGQAVPAQLSWSHYKLLIRIEDDNTRNFYIKESIDGKWSTTKRVIGVIGQTDSFKIG